MSEIKNLITIKNFIFDDSAWFSCIVIEDTRIWALKTFLPKAYSTTIFIITVCYLVLKPMRKLLYIVVYVAVLLLVASSIFLVYFWISMAHVPGQLLPRDSELYGWDPWPNVNYTTQIAYPGGTERTINLTFYADGFKRFPSMTDNRIRILVIGDSFTQADHVSDNEPYYAYLEDIPNVSVFVKGVNAWGTTQEYLFLNKSYDMLKPQIIILQFCDNDFINNDYNLEQRTYWQNIARIRPYFEHGKFIYKNPALIQLPLIGDSQLQRFINYKYDALVEKTISHDDNLELKIFADQYAVKDFNASIQTTDALIALFSARANHSKIFSFNACIWLSDESAYTRIMVRHNITVINVAPTLRTLALNNTVYTLDYHWTPIGHKAAGMIMRDQIEQYLYPKHS